MKATTAKRLTTAKVARKSRPRKKRNSDLARAERALWKAFAAYVKGRDGNSCFSCGAAGLEGRNWQAGHMYSADRFAIIRYHPLNVHSQCYQCNHWLGGNGAAYASRFIEVYGMDQFAYLSEIRRQPKQWKEYELRELVKALEKSGADYELLYVAKIGSFFVPSVVDSTERDFGSTN